MAGVEPLLILTVATLDLDIVPRRVRTNELIPNAQLGSCRFKQRRQIALVARKAVIKLKAVVRLNAFHLDVAARIPRLQPAKEVRRGVGGLLWIGREETQTRELVNSGVLEQTKLRISNASARNDFHIYLNALSGMGHLPIRLQLVRLFRLFGRKQLHFAHDPQQALRTAEVATLPQEGPELNHAQRWISAAHVTDELQLGFRVLV